MTLSKSILNGKRILAVDDEPDVLTIIQDEIMDVCPDAHIDTASDYESASQLLKSKEYDVVILDIMGVRGFDLLEIAVSHNFKTTMLTGRALSAEALTRSYRAGARSYLPKEKLGQLVPFLEDLFKYDHKAGWERVIEKLGDIFDVHFESEWRRKLVLDHLNKKED